LIAPLLQNTGRPRLYAKVPRSYVSGVMATCIWRVRLIAAAAFAIAGFVLAGCASSSVPSWLQIKPPPPPTQTLQFESEPPGADVRTADGQTCKTPCSLGLPLTAQTVSFAMDGYLPQTLPVEVQQSGERQADNSLPPPNFLPNPVAVALQAVAAKPVVKPKPHKPVKKTAKAATAKPASAAPAQDSAFPLPPPLNSPYPAPPPMPALQSPYPQPSQH
jgi:hypothetical protein